MTPSAHGTASRLPHAVGAATLTVVLSLLTVAFGAAGASAGVPAKCATTTSGKRTGKTKKTAGCGTSSSASTSAGGNGNVRIVNMSVTWQQPDGFPVDVYLAKTLTSGLPQKGGKVTALKPAPTKFVSSLAFGAATKYLNAPQGADLFVTAAGSPDILALNGVDPAHQENAAPDTYVIRSNQGPVLTTPTTTTTTVAGTFSYTPPLSLIPYDEPDDYTYSDGTGLPIKGSAVLLTHADGITEGSESDGWQMGVVGQGCLPQFGGGDPEYLGPGSGENGPGIEYISATPGDLQLGLWSDAFTDCSGSPVTTVSATVTAESRYYLYWWGPAASPKLLVVPVPAPKSKKFGPQQPATTTTGPEAGSSDSTTTTSSTTTTTSP